VEAAQRMIERSGKSLEQIAAACGFSSADLMRRAFVRTLGTPPKLISATRKSTARLRR
jgi:transcriptional regulator GlxA family with amidase domain